MSAPGGNESPQLSWTHAGRGTRRYAVVLFDVTANFTHWGVCNIPPSITELPAGSGAAGSGPGQQILNDAFNFGYSGLVRLPGWSPTAFTITFSRYTPSIRNSIYLHRWTFRRPVQRFIEP